MLSISTLYGQSISYFNILLKNKTDLKIEKAGFKSSFQPGYFLYKFFEFDIDINKSVNLLLSNYQYKDGPEVLLIEEEPGDLAKIGISGFGYNGIDLKRFDVGLSYKVKILNALTVRPFGTLGILTAKDDGTDLLDGVRINGPKYFIKGGNFIKKYEGTQLSPLLGIKLVYTLFRCIDLQFRVQGTLGFKSYLDLHINHKYKDGPDDVAIFQTKGTSFGYGIGIGYKFKWDEKKKKDNIE
jgi:hypothetical protein